MDLEALCKNASEAILDIAAQASDGFDRPDLDTEFVEPRNAVEATMAGYWQELLGVTKVGIHDNFFDLGGHSLIAVRLFRMIKKQYAVDFPISVLFEAPTIAQCASLVPDNGQETAETNADRDTAAMPAASKFVHLVTMHSGKDPTARPMFICAGMYGNVLNLRHLALALGQDRPVYGLQARGLYGDQEPHETFEEMARDYIAEMRMVQPEGPYLLAGYSGGGIAAYEIARQLQADGEEVAKLVMIDTPLPTQPMLSLRDRLTMKLQDLQRHKTAYLKKWLRDHIEVGKRKRRQREVVHEHGLTEQFNNERIEVAFRGALIRYQLQPYTGSVTLFRPKPIAFYRLSGGRGLLENRSIILTDNGWTPYLCDLSIVEVPGNHDNMVLQPNVSVLSAWMRETIGSKDRLPPKMENETKAGAKASSARPLMAESA
jgi:thioesterase domain-containing protein/acyl carrier protein